MTGWEIQDNTLTTASAVIEPEEVVYDAETGEVTSPN